MSPVRLPDEGDLPSLGGVTGWLNSPPLTPAGLRVNVVVVNFWTYTCINWLRQLPYVRAWAAEYADQGLVVIGVHTPEFAFEHNPGNVRRAVSEMNVAYPVALDNDYAIWRDFGNHYWPALYFADAQGRIRHHFFGEGEYRQSEMVIQQLLAETGHGSAGHGPVSVDARGVEAAADWGALYSPENYTGYERTENFASPGGAIPGKGHVYAAPAELGLNHWALSGGWTIGEQASTLNAADGQIAYRFHARDLHLVMGPAVPGTSLRSACSSTDSHRVPPTDRTLTARATARSPSNGSTSSSGSRAPSPTAPSRSPSSNPACRPSRLPSAKTRYWTREPSGSATPRRDCEGNWRMKLGIIADIRGNDVALRAVLAPVPPCRQIAAIIKRES